MPITRLELANLRNLQSGSLSPSPFINCIYGSNGSGKTSVLEALFLLGYGRSFRTAQIRKLINYKQEALTLFAEIKLDHSKHRLGIKKSVKENTSIRIDGENVRSAAKLAELLPVQVIHPDSIQLVDGSPVERRRYLDWGVFHVEHQFFSVWQHNQKALKQRNSLLRNARIAEDQLSVWDKEFVDSSNCLDKQRAAYLSLLQEKVTSFVDLFLSGCSVELSYYRGWSADRKLEDLLKENRKKEFERGFTQSGPHRCDIRLKTNGKLVADLFSRGQKKLVVLALQIAQAEMLKEIQQKNCLFLLDDLPSELDKANLKKVVDCLIDLDSQVFITAIDRTFITAVLEKDVLDKVTMFHVEHGVISQE